MGVGPKEDVYDEHFSPLVSALIELCNEHGISAFMHFELDDYCDDGDGEERRCMCTTSLPLAPDGDPGDERLVKMVRAARSGLDSVVATVSHVRLGVKS